MKHFVRTAYGDSKTHYSGDHQAPLQGGVQGNPASPPMWTAFTIVIISLLSSYGAGVAITSALSFTLICFTAILYVDDTDLFVMGKEPNEPIENVFTRTQAFTEIWDGVL